VISFLKVIKKQDRKKLFWWSGRHVRP